MSFCADAARHEAIRPVVEGAVALVERSPWARELEAVILVGSLARGEGSVLLGPGDGLRLLGDVEMLVILRGVTDWRGARRAMAALGAEATAGLGRRGRVASIEYTPADVRYLQRRVRPSIFAWDLLQHGKVLSGRPDILEEMKGFEVGDIPRADALELVMNRIVELLDAPEVRGGDPDPLAAAYRLDKTTLDLAGATLAFCGRHVSRYGLRPLALAELVRSAPERLPAAVADALVAELPGACRAKLQPTREVLLRAGRSERDRVLARARELWSWQAGRLYASTRRDATTPDLVRRYLGAEPLRERIRGWVKFLVHPLRPSGSVLAARRLSRLVLTASPRRLAYAAVLLASEGGQWENRAGRLLPSGGASDGPALQRAISLWHWLVRNN